MPTDTSRYFAARPVIRAVAVACAVLAAVVGLAVGVSIITGNAASERTSALTELERYAYAWQTKVGTRLTEAQSLAASGAAYAAGGATHTPNHTLSTRERVQFINNDSWPIIAASLFRQVPGVLSLQLQPSGIIAQMWPPNTAPQNLDTWVMPHLQEGYRQLVGGGVPVAAGPIALVQGGMGILVRYPVYLGPTHTLEDFWGAGVVVFRISDMLAAMNISETHAADGYEVVVFAEDTQNATKPPIVIMTAGAEATAAAAAGRVRPADSFTVRIETSDPNNALYLTTLKTGGLPSGAVPSSDVAAVVVPTAVGALVIAGVVFGVALLSFKLKHLYVPATSGEEATPMALVSLQQLGWWTERQAPEQLASDLLDFEREAGRIAVAHGCHLSGRISEGCCLVVSESGASIDAFARAAAAELPKLFAAVKLVHSGHGVAVSTVQHTRAVSDSTTPKNSQAHRQSVAGTVRSSKQRGGSSRQRAGAAARGFEFAVSMHVGSLHSTYDPEVDRYSFFGAGVAAAAMGVDATLSGEVTATAAFAEAGNWKIVPRNTPSRRLDDDEESELFVVVSPEAKADDARKSFVRNTNARKMSNMSATSSNADSAHGGAYHAKGGAESGGGVASALAAKTGVAVRRRVALLVLELLPTDGWNARDRAPPVPNFPEVLETIAAVAARHNGELASVVGGRVVVAFNAVKPVTAPSRSAALADADLRVSLPGRRVVSVVTQGFAHVAVAAGSLLVCMGEPVRRSAALLDEVVALNAKDHSLESTVVTDGTTAQELRQAFELQCVGPSAAEGVGLRFLVERAWPEDDDEQGDEWLYELQRLEGQSRFTPVNAAVEAWQNGRLQESELAAAQALLNDEGSRAALHPLALAALRACVEGAATGVKTVTPQQTAVTPGSTSPAPSPSLPQQPM